MEKPFNIQLDMKKSIKNEYIEVVLGDTANVFNIAIVDNYTVVNLTGLTLKAIITKADGNTVYQDSTNGLTVTDAVKGLVTLKLKVDSVSATGNTIAEIVFFEGTDRITSSIFSYYVRGAQDTGNVPISTSEVVTVNNFLTSLDSKIDKSIINLDTEAKQAIDANLALSDSKVASAEAIRESKMSDIENRFTHLTTAQQQGAEVTNAHISTSYGKTFLSIGDRMEETEKNIITINYKDFNENAFIVSHGSPVDGTFKDLAIGGNTINDGGVLKSVGVLQSDGKYRVEALSRNRNLIDKSKNTTNSVINQVNGTVNVYAGYQCTNFIKIKPNTAYFLSNNETPNTVLYDEQFNYIKYVSGKNITFTTTVNSYYIRVSAKDSDVNILQLEEGTTPTPYVPHEEDKINISLTQPLRKLPNGVMDKYSEGVRYGNISDWKTLDGSLTWFFYGSNVGQKRFNTSFPNMKNIVAGGDTGYVLDSNSNKLLFNIYADAIGSYCIDDVIGGSVVIGVKNADSGFVDSVTPSSAEGKAYFYGWKMCMSDGATWDGVATKYWKKITDGTGITSVLPIATYAGYTPYKMLYQLATPTTETITCNQILKSFTNGSIAVNCGTVTPNVNFKVPYNLKTANESLSNAILQLKAIDDFTSAYLLNLEARVTLLEKK